MRESNSIFFVIFLIIAISIVFQLKFGDVTGYGYDIVLVLLIVASFFLSFFELLVLVFLGIFFLNWQPGISIEMISFLVLPALSFWGRRIFPGKAWFGGIGFLALGIFLFYLTVDFIPMFYSAVGYGDFTSSMWQILGSFVGNFIFGVLFGVLVFYILGYFYGKKLGN